ncbi:F-box/FBD/LRR-repeat protein [Actinidia chinensis var. chinensis]|uniref:F-box/FBD/LRR-repeat protein n=1 Tax=Actinidia chinensis var. chinensis TaxID=1590841 RepID=A0A2R6P709_ACTCC|nr:F-box/FBD/LRR-repeat protein [Actinidia chinensis var. chinensis]
MNYFPVSLSGFPSYYPLLFQSPPITKSTTKFTFEEDGISVFTDEILLHILSFLPTKHAVGTSILSKRWKNLWTELTDLDFDYELEFHPLKVYYPGNRLRWLRSLQFKTFVDKVIRERISPRVRKFSLRITRLIHVRCLNEWISAAIERGVQEIDISIHVEDKDKLVELPQCLFNCETLVVLKLKSLLQLTNVASSVCLPNLKTLHLDIHCKNVEFIQKLINSCPSLEDLSTHGDDIKIIFPNLKRLNAWKTSNMVVDTPKLQYLSLRCESVPFRSDAMKELPALVEANVMVEKGTINEIKDLLRKISHARRLAISTPTICDVSCYKIDDVPEFPNLNYLEFLPLESCDVLRFLKLCPRVETLVVNLDKYKYPFDESSSIDSQTQEVPGCLLVKLQQVTIDNFAWWRDHVGLLIYMLTNARVLKKMTIKLSFGGSILVHENLASLLNRYRGSCQIFIANPTN